MKTISKLASVTALAVAAFSSANAQSNLGASCGCPPVASRPTVLMSTLSGATSLVAGKEVELQANNILSCDKTYILDQKISVAAGKNLTIRPGTVIKGRTRSTADSATALIIERGAQIIADGTAECPIVFTAEADPMDGTYPMTNTGKWGGIVISGRATNNLTLAANGPFTVAGGKLAKANGVGVFEGFATDAPRFYYGADISGTLTGTPESFDDNDNSGTMRYVQIRHSGAALTVGGEINGLSLCSVGRGTTVDHVDIIACNDDGIEFFGGTVNVKYISMLYGNDDMFDYDLGWSGKAQFLFGMKAENSVQVDADNGFEMDADDQKSNNTPRSHPIIYNATIIGNSKAALSSDNSGLAALEAKELTEGEVYQSVFANFRYGLNLIKSLGTRPGTSEAYHNWANTGGNGSNSLKVKCNTFTGMTKAVAIDKNGTGTVLASDSTQFFTTDMNTHVASIAGFDYAFTANYATNTITHAVDATPNPAIATTGCPAVPVDGFFVNTNYRGAFASTGKNWLQDWTYATMFGGAVVGTQSCPTDINQDGITNNVDFLQLLGQFGQSCH